GHRPPHGGVLLRPDPGEPGARRARSGGPGLLPGRDASGRRLPRLGRGLSAAALHRASPARAPRLARLLARPVGPAPLGWAVEPAGPCLVAVNESRPENCRETEG